jgi:hypothetical protein
MEINMMPSPIPVAVWPKAVGTQEERGFSCSLFQTIDSRALQSLHYYYLAGCTMAVRCVHIFLRPFII